MWHFLRRWPVIPIAVLATLIIVGIFAPYIAPENPISQNLADRNTKPSWMGGKDHHLLGGDHVGRDILSRIIYGSRIELLVMSVSMSTGLVVGTSLGLLSGYFGGMTDEVITRFVDLWLGFPFLLLALVVAVVIGPSLTVVLALLALLAWSQFVRNIRADVLVIIRQDYVAYARASGASDIRILVRHIFPGVVGTMTVIASLSVGGLILAEATLSFLGAGIPEPTPSWGLMISDAQNYIQTAWWTSVFPGVALFLVVMSLNFLGDWVRDRLDPRLRQLD